MPPTQTWTLTDRIDQTHAESFELSPSPVGLAAAGWKVKRSTLRGGLADGVDCIEIANGALSFQVLPTRGMGLWRGQFRGIPLGWQAPIIGPVHPRFVPLWDHGGIGWLYGFDEWLCRCGLASNGPPGEDVRTDEHGRTLRTPLTLHGRIANLPAHKVELLLGSEPPHPLSIRGEVEEGGLFLGRLHLTTTYTTWPGSNRLTIHDQVRNRGSQPAEMQLLYHFNWGAPLLEPESRIRLPIEELAPLTPRGAEGIDRFDVYAAPQSGFAEQVYACKMRGNGQGETLAMLHNAHADRAAVLRWNVAQLPCFTIWKNTAHVTDGYVTGLEPATNFPNFKSFERQQGRVVVLPPGGIWECTWHLDLHDTATGVADVRAEIAALQGRAAPIIHRQPTLPFSPVR